MPCGLESGISSLAGLGDVNNPNAVRAGRDYGRLVQGYTNQVPALFGSAATYQPQYTDLMLRDWQRIIPTLTGVLSGVAPQAAGLVRGLSPEQTGLMDLLRSRATTQLEAGAEMDPELRRLFQQSVRGGQAARGMGFGPADVLEESLGLTKFGQELRQQREQFGQGVAGLGFQTETDPIMRLLTGIPSAAGGIAQSSQSQLLSPAGSLNLLTTPYQGQLAASTASAANRTSLMNASTANSNWM